MREFKNFMRGVVAVTSWLVISFAFGYWGRMSVSSETSYWGDLLWLTGVMVIGTTVFIGIASFVIWLTDGKWELDEEESEDDEEESE